MKKISGLLALIALVYSNVTVAQDLYGEATYISKTSIDKSWMDENRDLTPERRKSIEENLKKMSEKVYLLQFTSNTALFKEEVALDAPGSGQNWGRFMGNMTGGDKFKDMTAGTFTEQRDMMGKTFLIKDKLPKYDWQITGESRKIGNYTAIKATATKQPDAFDFGNWRRRPASENAEQKKKDSIAQANGNTDSMFDKPKEIVITAWFTPEIPVQHGPKEYGGLPGLILEVNEGKTVYLLTEIKLNPAERKEFKPATKGTVVTQAEYDTTLKVKTDEMQERFRGGGGRGRN